MTNVRNGLVDLGSAQKTEIDLDRVQRDAADKNDEFTYELCERCRKAEASLAEVLRSHATSLTELRALSDAVLAANGRLKLVEEAVRAHVPHLKGNEKTGWALAAAVRDALSSGR